MALLLLSNNTMSRSGVRAVSMRGALLMTLSVALLLVAFAFSIGLMMGKSLNNNAVGGPGIVKAPNPVQEKFTITRLGELTARLLRLESDAAGLINKIGTLEGLERKLSAIQSGMLASAIAPQQIPRHIASGGPALAPKPCDQGNLKTFEPVSAESKIVQTERTIGCLQQLLSQIEQAAATRSVAYMAIPSQRPVAGTLGSPFGNRVDPINGRFAFHSGLDFAADIGSPIHAAGGGQVRFAGFQNELGNMIEIDHGNGLVTRYAHASKLYVKVGDIITPTQVIAAVGSTGRSTGPHLHFEVMHKGRYVNPAYYLSLGGETPGV